MSKSSFNHSNVDRVGACDIRGVGGSRRDCAIRSDDPASARHRFHRRWTDRAD